MEPLAGQAALSDDSGSSTGVSVSLNERWIACGLRWRQVLWQEEFG
jgi:hypothetical protein